MLYIIYVLPLAVADLEGACGAYAPPKIRKANVNYFYLCKEMFSVAIFTFRHILSIGASSKGTEVVE
jgi:hypothetical protein